MRIFLKRPNPLTPTLSPPGRGSAYVIALPLQGRVQKDHSAASTRFLLLVGPRRASTGFKNAPV
jgi:hypothetical protein